MSDPSSTEDVTLPPSANVDPAATLAPAASSPHGTSAAPPGYELLGELGRGGMGVVYKAKQTALNRIVALKMILSGAHAGDAERQRFRAEAEAVARLAHPGIVTIHEVGEHDGNPFFSLEFCPGGSLAAKLDGTPWAARQAAEFVRTLALASEAAHQRAVVHRDLKPANVLFGDDGAPKITDFGLAKKLGEQSHTQTGSVVGTPSYMAPEQAEGKKDVGPAADTYALGAILYELLTGRPPFRAETALDTIMQVVSDEPASPRQLNAKVPRDLETITLKCLQKDPARRYATASDLAADLAAFVAGEPIRARPVGTVERAVKWAKRRPGVASSVAVGAALAVLAFALVSWQWLRAESAREREADRAAAEKEARQEADRNKRDAQRLAANVLIERGVGLCEQGDEARGVLTLVRALEVAEPDEPELAERARRLLGGWSQRIQPLTSVLHSWRDDFLAVADKDPNADKFNEMQLSVNLVAMQSRPNRTHGWGPLRFLQNGKRLAIETSPLACVLIDPVNDRVVWPRKKLAGRDVLALAPDGRTALLGDAKSLLTLDARAEASLWDLETDRPLSKPLAADGKAVLLSRALFSPDGKTMLTWGGEIRLWDVPSGSPRAVLPVAGPMLRVTFADDGKRLMTVVPTDAEMRQPGEVRIWDVTSGKKLFEPALAGCVVEEAALSPDGRRVVALFVDAKKRTRDLRLCDVDAAKTTTLAEHGFPALKAIPTEKREQYRKDFEQRQRDNGGNPVPPGHRLVFSPDSHTLATGPAEVAQVRLWDVQSGLPRGKPHYAIGAFLSFTANNAVWLVEPVYHESGPFRQKLDAPSNRMRLLDVRTGEARSPVIDGGTTSALTPDDSVLVTGEYTECRFLDVATGRSLGPPVQMTSIEAVNFSPDGRTFAALDQNGQVWFRDVPRPGLTRLAERVVCVSSGGAFVLTMRDDNRLEVRRRTGEVVGKPFDPPEEAGKKVALDQRTSNVGLSADGRFVVANAGRLRVADSRTGLWRVLKDKPVSEIVLDPSGKRLGTSLLEVKDNSSQFKIDLWDLATAERAVPTRTSRAGTLAVLGGQLSLFWHFSEPGGREDVGFGIASFATGAERTVPLAGAGTFSLRFTLPGGPDLSAGDQLSLFSPDGRLVALISENEKMLRLWRLSDGEPLAWERSFPHTITPTVFSPDGKSLLCRDGLGRGHWLDVSSGLSMMAPMVLPKDVGNFTFADGGRTLLFRGDGQRLYSMALPGAVEGEPPRVRLWAETITGQELKAGGIRQLEAREWHARRERLRTMGGPPASTK